MTCDGLGKWRAREVMTLGVSVEGSDVFFLADVLIFKLGVMGDRS